MKKQLLFAAAALAFALPALAQDAEPEGPPSPNQIVAEAPASEWVRISKEDLLVMTLAPDSEGNARKVVIQLMPAPFSQGWVSNIRTFARAKWFDTISVNRVQDNYVVQWGDVNYDNPEATGEVKALPEGLKVMDEDDYVSRLPYPRERYYECSDAQRQHAESSGGICVEQRIRSARLALSREGDAYAPFSAFYGGWPIGYERARGEPFALSKPEIGEAWEVFDRAWPVHCYGMVGVGRNYSPDTGSGAELYTVIGHAPRHLDRNIALVGRVIEGMEHLSSLPRGKGDLGFYREDEFDKRTPILSVRVASDLPDGEQPQFEYLSTEGETFAKYTDARANRRDPFFIVPAGGADICNIPVPVRRVK